MTELIFFLRFQNKKAKISWHLVCSPLFLPPHQNRARRVITCVVLIFINLVFKNRAFGCRFLLFLALSKWLTTITACYEKMRSWVRDCYWTYASKKLLKRTTEKASAKRPRVHYHLSLHCMILWEKIEIGAKLLLNRHEKSGDLSRNYGNVTKVTGLVNTTWICKPMAAAT